MLQMIGGVLLLMGVLSGAFLLLQTLGLGPASPGLTTWAMFPILSVCGYLLLAQAARKSSIAMISALAGGALLLLGLAAMIVVFLAANGFVAAPGDELALWYVVAVGFVLGGVGFAVRGFGRDAQSPDTAV